jgi:hypothetical protein
MNGARLQRTGDMKSLCSTLTVAISATWDVQVCIRFHDYKIIGKIWTEQDRKFDFRSDYLPTQYATWVSRREEHEFRDIHQ